MAAKKFLRLVNNLVTEVLGIQTSAEPPMPATSWPWTIRAASTTA
ncbi:hypothetical protein [Delftia sp.]|nr:hypothetical protein [Delftia sp.]